MGEPAPKKIIAFLDRDGVLNEEVNLLHRKDQLRLLPGAADGVRELNRNGILVVVVTNQPVVARGLCTEADVDAIHDTMRDLLASKGAHLDAIHSCPHHENADLPQYRKVCPDRKPNIGMLQAAAAAFHVSLPACFMIGDRTVDVQTGINAGCKTILVQTGFAGRDGKHQVTADHVAVDLREAADIVVAAVRRERG